MELVNYGPRPSMYFKLKIKCESQGMKIFSLLTKSLSISLILKQCLFHLHIYPLDLTSSDDDLFFICTGFDTCTSKENNLIVKP
jgi:hypothetical protein